MEKRTLEEVTLSQRIGLISFLGTHATSAILGAYEGRMNSQGIDANINFGYVLGPNIISATFISLALSVKISLPGRIVSGATLGAATGSVANLAGYAVGYLGGHLINNLS